MTDVTIGFDSLYLKNLTGGILKIVEMVGEVHYYFTFLMKFYLFESWLLPVFDAWVL